MKIDMLPMAVNFASCEEMKICNENREDDFLNLLNNKIENSFADKSENINEVEFNDINEVKAEHSENNTEDELIALIASILNSIGAIKNAEAETSKNASELTMNMDSVKDIIAKVLDSNAINLENLDEVFNSVKIEELFDELNFNLDKLALSKEEKSQMILKLLKAINEDKLNSNMNESNFDNNIKNGEVEVKKGEFNGFHDTGSMQQDITLENTKDLKFINNTSEVKEKLFDLGTFKHRNIINEEKPSDSQGELNLLNRIAFSSDSKVEIPKEAAPTIVRNEFLGADVLKVVKYISNNRIEELSVKITPKELGEVSIKLLKVEDNNELIITLANKKAYELIKDNVSDIEKHLSSLDIKIKNVVVQVKGEVYGDFLGNFNEQFSKNNSRGQQKNNLTKERNSFEEEQEGKRDESNLNLLV